MSASPTRPILRYFIQSDKFPEVGVAPEIKAKNLKQLNKMIEMAHARGIKVSLMAYEAQLSIPKNAMCLTAKRRKSPMNTRRKWWRK